MKIVASSDWHLDWVTGGFPRFSDIRQRVDRVVDFAISEQADLFAFAGDLSNPDSAGVHAAVEVAAHVASKLSAHGVPSVWLAGNHDVVEDGCGTSTLAALAGMARGGVTNGSVRVFERPGAFGHLGCGIVALPYPPRSTPYDPGEFVTRLEPIAPGVPVVVFGHLWIEGVDPGSETIDMPRGRSVFWPVSEIRAAWGDNAIMIGGHYHAGGIYNGVHVIGAPERMTFGEYLHEPSFMVVEVSS